VEGFKTGPAVEVGESKGGEIEEVRECKGEAEGEPVGEAADSPCNALTAAGSAVAVC
jgi:hypothetical protein